MVNSKTYFLSADREEENNMLVGDCSEGTHW